MYIEETIAAIATPPGEGGVAIIRVSGPDAERIANTVFVRDRGRNRALESHRLYQGAVRDPRTEKILDKVLLAIMRKPRSYTGEDVVEVHCHGGVFLVRQVLGLIFSQGARSAEPGEFTKRAFLNGRLDLPQAEAVLDLIHARTDRGVELAIGQATGVLSEWVAELREQLLGIMVHVEAAIDFPEEEIELLQRQELISKISDLISKIDKILATYEWGRLFREGARVCICGRPNVGKSSLMNALLGEDRVIVTAFPGTTRDVIEESINLAGLPVVLWDTAGIRATENEAEKMGVERSLHHLEKADAAIVVLDGSDSITDEDRFCLDSIDRSKSFLVVNKRDLDQRIDLGELKKLAAPMQIIFTSAKQGEGLKPLLSALRECLLRSDSEPKIVLTNLRHKNALVTGLDSLKAACASLEAQQPPECVAMDLHETKNALDEIIGSISNEDILERIFADFCIGK